MTVAWQGGRRLWHGLCLFQFHVPEADFLR